VIQETAPISEENKPLVVLHTGHLRSRYTVTVSYAIGVLLFLLPFLNIKCNSVKLASATGLQLVIGKVKNEYKNSKEKSGDLKDLIDNRKINDDVEDILAGTQGKEKLVQPNYFMLTALGLGIIGIIFSILGFRKRWLFSSITAWISVACFLITLISISFQASELAVDSTFLALSIQFTLWFYISFAAYIAAGIFSHKQANIDWRKWKQKEIDDYIKASQPDQGVPLSSFESVTPNSISNG
jgi:lysylphosphatidylglycerol synthetase-like protein (DUF2156 family)